MHTNNNSILTSLLQWLTGQITSTRGWMEGLPDHARARCGWAVHDSTLGAILVLMGQVFCFGCCTYRNHTKIYSPHLCLVNLLQHRQLAGPSAGLRYGALYTSVSSMSVTSAIPIATLCKLHWIWRGTLSEAMMK